MVHAAYEEQRGFCYSTVITSQMMRTEEEESVILLKERERKGK
jgi:hypothetical protein